jgi:hemolysin activation/secretion protein
LAELGLEIRGRSFPLSVCYRSTDEIMSAVGALGQFVSTEEFGADGVRGYLEAEVLADRGVKGGVQLGAPQLTLFKSALTLDGFAFFDYGTVSVLKPLPGEISSTSLQSWGIGVDLAALNHFTGSLVWAYPLRDASHTERGDSRVLFDIRTSW